MCSLEGCRSTIELHPRSLSIHSAFSNSDYLTALIDRAVVGTRFSASNSLSSKQPDTDQPDTDQSDIRQARYPTNSHYFNSHQSNSHQSNSHLAEPAAEGGRSPGSVRVEGVGVEPTKA